MPPSIDEQQDVLLACRYGDLDDVKQFITAFGAQAAAEVRDDNGNSALHMLCGNGHEGYYSLLLFVPQTSQLYSTFLDLLDYLLPILPSSLLSAQNNAQSTPLHWAALNSHLNIVKKLVEFPGGPGVDLIDIKNAAGRSPLAEAELTGWDEGAQWLVQMMKLDDGVKEGEGEPDAEDAPLEPGQKVEIEIQDADGELAKMTIGGRE
ncbi:Ankyrin repeat-containing protein P16F5.05c [Mycena indigotica]|uniref:Ankyrin repeat-containing protein P16F5.05c n=1 Tax=Mycena indigotica TaxID=2126181 RepID=A0A8H6VPE8_9AGAR|nr:Ankyrin repeat-containing protein P16F5.05c [Mycena indigotica]KAF7289232.1 Ankyrin repeat-containing protein P16F5.05c [Mycena indigotica]